MDLNILKYLFLFMSIFTFVAGLLINLIEGHLPAILLKTYRYGKFAYDGAVKVHLIEVPKRWFKHFYVFSSLYSLLALHLIVTRCIHDRHLPANIYVYLDFFGGKTRQSSVEPAGLLLAAVMLSVQSLRRFYETWFISVFSEGKMNLSHYLIGYLHYWGATTIMLSEAKNFEGYGDFTPLKIAQLSLLDVLAVAVFIFAWCYQYQCAMILANLRKNKKGEITSKAHKIPQGGLFEVLSSPHLTCEVLIYIALSMVLRKSSTFPYVLLWVATNQVEAAYLNHQWYKKTFKNYPEKRKVFIPYLF